MRPAPVHARARVRQGWSRVTRAAVPVLLASVAAGGAWAVARYGLGHTYPFFAPVSAWVALGFSADRQPRRVAELAIGVAVGVLLGDLLVQVIGTGAVQVAVVLAAAALVARFIDRGDLLAIQAGVQAIVIVGLPAAQAGSSLGRWVDALVGGGLALVVAALSPQDPRRRVRHLAEEAVSELAGLLRNLGHGLSEGDEEEIEEALVRGRSSQPVLDQWLSVAGNARKGARMSPAFHRHVGELRDLELAAVHADRAMRNARVLVRRAQVAAHDRHDVAALAALITDIARGTDQLAAALAAGSSTASARTTLLAAAGATDPWALAPDDWHVQGLVLLLRSLVVDLLETAGLDPQRAREALPEI